MKKYNTKIGLAIRELFVQFFMRISDELPSSKLAVFSKLKYINGDGFSNFRKHFYAKFNKGFVVPAYTFDNVKGNFPISFLIWDLNKKEKINNISVDTYSDSFSLMGKKIFSINENNQRITDWISNYNKKNQLTIGYTGNNGPDFQNNNYCLISSIHKINNNGSQNNATKYFISNENLIPMTVYFAVRHCIESNWLNDRDQFLFPNDGWENDKEFQNDCFTFTLFHSQNRIRSKDYTNHWIPFTEYEVGAREKFASNFMTDFINGKDNPLSDNFVSEPLELFGSKKVFRDTPLVFSPEAKAVFDVGRELWKYYHAQKDANPNASLYDIREYFQGRNDKGRMNSKSSDGTYTKLIALLREKLNLLADKIAPKVYEYEFLKQ